MLQRITPQPCDIDHCPNAAYWSYAGYALCFQELLNMAYLNSDNEEAFKPAVEEYRACVARQRMRQEWRTDHAARVPGQSTLNNALGLYSNVVAMAIRDDATFIVEQHINLHGQFFWFHYKAEMVTSTNVDDWEIYMDYEELRCSLYPDPDEPVWTRTTRAYVEYCYLYNAEVKTDE